MSRGRERGYRASKSFVSILSALDTVLCSVFLKAPTLALALTPPIPNFLLSASPQPLPFPLRVAHFFPLFFGFYFFPFFFFFLSPPFFYSIPPPSQDRHKSTHRSLSDIAWKHRETLVRYKDFSQQEKSKRKRCEQVWWTNNFDAKVSRIEGE